MRIWSLAISIADDGLLHAGLAESRHTSQDQEDRGRDPARKNARITIKILDRCLEKPTEIGEIQPASVGDASPLRGRATVELLADPLGRVPLPLDDDEIIDRALAVQDLSGWPVTLITGDVGMSTRARFAGSRSG